MERYSNTLSIGALSVSGSITAGSDITAFASDDRLKRDKVGISGALDKVLSLNGFTYNFNETAGNLGFDTEVRYAGVSAQEVKKVLPEQLNLHLLTISMILFSMRNLFLSSSRQLRNNRYKLMN